MFDGGIFAPVRAVELARVITLGAEAARRKENGDK